MSLSDGGIQPTMNVSPSAAPAAGADSEAMAGGGSLSCSSPCSVAGAVMASAITAAIPAE